MCRAIHMSEEIATDVNQSSDTCSIDVHSDPLYHT